MLKSTEKKANTKMKTQATKQPNKTTQYGKTRQGDILIMFESQSNQ